MNNIGLIGLGVMGENLVLNMHDHGFAVSVYNRTFSVTQDFIAQNTSEKLQGFETLKDFVQSLERPRKIILLVKAGEAVDAVIQELLPLLDPEDIVIDSGNSFYRDTDRRSQYLAEQKIRFIGLGISGGEEGARHGPSFMAGGDIAGYQAIEPILKQIAAKDFSGNACVAYFGTGSAGHFVKMIHNGIEYVDMQLIADFYFLLQHASKDNTQIASTFEEWNNGKSGSYLLEITIKILRTKDSDGTDLIDKILDTASQKGTGQWASVYSLEAGVPSSAFADVVYARYLSAQKPERTEISKLYPKPQNCLSLVPHDLENAYFVTKLLSYAQGLEIIKNASEANNWNIDLSECVRVWQGGCIIRAKLLEMLQQVLKDSPGEHMLKVSSIQTDIQKYSAIVHEIAAEAIKNQIPLPGISACVQYLDGYTTSRLPANLIAAQRDFFGAHSYKRVDQEGDFHTAWGQ